MSIIYDALQKTQRNREYIQGVAIQKKSNHHSAKWIFISLVGFFVCSMVAAGFFYLDVTKSFSRFQPPKENSFVVKPLMGEKPVSSQLSITMNAKKLPVATSPENKTLTAGSPSTPMANEIDNKNKLILNGVLISGLDKVALINNQSFRLGDTVEGMKIVGIEFNSVKLQNEQRMLELRVAV